MFSSAHSPPEHAESEEKALKRVSRLFGPRRYDFVSGLYTEGVDRQNFYSF